MELSPDKQYSMYEAIVDITLQVSCRKFVSVNSRLLVEHIVEWAKEFERVNKDVEWGITTEFDYIDAIEQFTDLKIKEAVKLELGYIDV